MLLNTQDKKDPKILVVDDSATNRALLRAILKAGGYQVLEAEDGKQCLELCAHESPQIVLLDVMMPVVDGLTACRKLRENFTKSELPIIMVTTIAEEDGLADGLGAGANDYITKPIDRATLLARLENQLSLARAQQQIVEQSKQLEKALRIQQATGDILPEAILVHDQKGGIVYRNKTCVQFCQGATPPTMQELCLTIFGGKYKDAMLDCYRGSLAIPDFEFARDLLHSRVPYHTVSVMTRPIESTDGVLRLWVWRDDTERTELERSVNQRMKLETVGMFATGVAHNFNNYMGAVLGATEVLDRMTKENERAQRCVQVIRKAIDSGRRLTRKMSLVYSQDKTPRVGENQDFSSMLREVVDCYRQSLDNRITFDVQVAADLPHVILPGPVLLEIIANILSNAIESIAETGTVLIAASQLKSLPSVQVCVRDSGRGMDEAELSRIYEPFFSTKNFDKLSGVAVEGRGLGMWNTYNLVSSYRGSLSIESKPGVGTTVTMILPTVS